MKTFLHFVLDLFLIIFLNSVSLTNVDATSDNPQLTFDTLYTDGVNSYLENNWPSCITYLEHALDDWQWWNKNIVKCRKKCYQEADSAQLIFPDSEDFEFDRVYEKMIVNTLCLVKCKKQVFGQRKDEVPPSDIVQDFQLMKPYDYLQLCYFKNGQIDQAANAAATFLSKVPEHEVMQSNLRFYVKEGGLDVQSIVNLELGEYAKEYIEGDAKYQKEDYVGAIENLERSLDLYWEALYECRLGCEKPFDQGWLPDFIPSFANHYTFTLRCKRKCPSVLANLYGEELKDFVASIFNYLQFSYYKVGNLEKGCEAVESYLLLDPEDPSQQRNRQFFWTQEGVKEEFFTPRKEVVKFRERMMLEAELLKFIEVNFAFFTDNAPEPNTPEATGESPDAAEVQKRQQEERKREVNFLKTFSSLRIRLIADEKKLKGENRFLAAGFLSDELCSRLVSFTQMASVEGDGYIERKNPHTSSESFQGVTLSRASMAVVSGLSSPSMVETILNATDFCKSYLHKRFSLKKPLYFSFTHLVCRTGVRDPSERNVTDLSHEVHADNCILQSSGQCLKIPPAYTFRDYSAILYLNSDFEGGEFFFSKDRSGVEFESLVKPHCGHLVGFSAGKENLHGVRPVLRGTRCALAMWFTFDQKNAEVERSWAEQLLVNIKEGKIVPSAYS